MPRTKPTKKTPAGGGQRDDVPLIIPVPGGSARFYAQRELTPRRTRALDVQLTRFGPRMRQLAVAEQVIAPDGTLDTSAVLDGPAMVITEDEAESFAAINDLAAWVYLKSWTLDRALPETPDDVLDLPTPLYNTLVAHAARLVAHNLTAQDDFTVAGLGDDIDEADEDLPTSA